MKQFKKRLKKILQKSRKYVKSIKWKRYSIILLTFLIALYCILFIFAKYIEGYATFPGMLVDTLSYSPENWKEKNITFEDINIPYKSENINGLFLYNGAQQTVYYLHGNGGDLSYFYNEIEIISSLGYNVLALDYPGYGRSTGFPHEDKVQEYTKIFFEYAQEKYKLDTENTILWGYSIGTGVALDFARKQDFSKIVLQSPYTSRYDLSRAHYGLAIQKMFFLPNSFISKQNIQHITQPILIIHGAKDVLIPFSQGKKLYDIGNKETISFIEVPEGTHYNLLHTEIVLKKIQAFLSIDQKRAFYDVINTKALEDFLLQKELDSFDLETDDSLTKYVDPDISFIEKGYIPEDMRTLKRDYITDTKGNAKMREVAAQAFESMAEAFYKEFEEKIVVVSSYRSYNYQAGIKARGCPDNLCAKAGHSEHQSGLTADLWSASSREYWNSSTRLSKYHLWLSQHAHEYGFHNPYQKGREVDGYEIEPWHWRYLGVKLATYLKKQDITFAEFYKNREK